MSIKINVQGENSDFLRMLAYIEILGGWGHSTDFRVGVDGDGNARYKFTFDSEDKNEQYKSLKKLIAKKVNENGDIKSFIL